MIAAAFRDALAVATDTDRAAVNADQLPAVQALAARSDPLELAGIIEALSRCEQLLWRNVNPKIVWDNVAITCTSARPLLV